MDSLSSSHPVHHTSLAPEEFEEGGPSGEDTANFSAVDLPNEPEPVTLRERYVQPRFDAILARHRGNTTCVDLLNELYRRLQVNSREVVYASSVRCYSLDFVLVGLSGHYEQKSQADVASAIWDLKGDVLEPSPNLSAQLVLDGDALVSCSYFAAAGELCKQKVDEGRLCCCFGSENLARLGKALLQFLGAICADSGAPRYASRLPFGLPADVLRLEADEEAVKAATAEQQPPVSPHPAATAQHSTPVAPASAKPRSGSRNRPMLAGGTATLSTTLLPPPTASRPPRASQSPTNANRLGRAPSQGRM